VGGGGGGGGGGDKSHLSYRSTFFLWTDISWDQLFKIFTGPQDQ
jgi:hypothetical protein